MQEKTKYGFSIDSEVIKTNINRLTNQLWKLIPMRENNENWETQLSSLIVEISGLGEIFKDKPQYIVLLSKLEGLIQQEIEFKIYRKIVFESISALREVVK